MALNTIWFILMAILFIGFFFLEGFDFGVGILLPFIAKDDKQRRMVINTIGPHWDGNEVWLITAGGAMFAAFPHMYATFFSGLYLALVVLLLALIVRGVAFEFRSKDERPQWRAAWDWSIFVGSLVPAFLFGVAMSNLLHGLPIKADMQYAGSFFDLLNPYTLMSGLASTIIFTLHGALFLSLKVEGPLMDRSMAAAKRLWPFAVIVGAIAVGLGYFWTDMYERLGLNPGVIPLTAGGAMLAAGYFIHRKQSGWGFVLTGISIVFSTISLFMGLYPRLIVSSLNPNWSLTIHNAASSPYTLRVMSMVALIFVPIVLLYQGWSYFIFRRRLTAESHLEY